jgi:hypothetical protein
MSPTVVRAKTCRKLPCVGHTTLMLKIRNTYMILAEKPLGKRLLRRPKSRWIYQVHKKLGKIGLNCEGGKVDGTGSGSCLMTDFVIYL